MEHAVEKTVPTRQMCSRSKPWWNQNLTIAFKDMRTARDMARSYFQHFNCQSEIMTTEALYQHKRTLQLVKKAKREYYLKLTEKANSQNLWNFRKWTMGKRTYISPALSR